MNPLRQLGAEPIRVATIPRPDVDFCRRRGRDECGLTPTARPEGAAVLELDDAGRASAAKSIRRADGSDQKAFRLNAWMKHGPRAVEPGAP